MKSLFKYTLFVFLTGFFGNSAWSQTNCDSLIIDCCDFQLIGNDTVFLTVENTATQAGYGYPGFILLNDMGDTMAMETVNYFGIGMGQQVHVLDVLNQIDIPFTGTLQLWGGFYDTLYCEFPVFIIASIDENEHHIDVYPNPVTDYVQFTGVESGTYDLYTVGGKSVKLEQSFTHGMIDVRDLPSGMYFIEIQSTELRSAVKTKILKE